MQRARFVRASLFGVRFSFLLWNRWTILDCVGTEAGIVQYIPQIVNYLFFLCLQHFYIYLSNLIYLVILLAWLKLRIVGSSGGLDLFGVVYFCFLWMGPGRGDVVWHFRPLGLPYIMVMHAWNNKIFSALEILAAALLSDAFFWGVSLTDGADSHRWRKCYFSNCVHVLCMVSSSEQWRFTKQWNTYI